MIAITNSPSENHTHRGVVSCDRCFIASSQPGRTIQAQALDSRNCARLLGCHGICPHRLARYQWTPNPIAALVFLAWIVTMAIVEWHDRIARPEPDGVTHGAGLIES